MAEDRESNQAQYMAALYEAGAFLQNNDDAGNFLKLNLSLAVRHTRADQGYLLLRNEHDTTFQVIAAQDKNGDTQSGDLDLVVRSLLDRAVETGRSAVVSDVTGDERLAGVPIAEKQAVSYLIVPMLSGSRVAGVICLAGHATGRFGEDQRAFVNLLGSQAALVVEKARQAQLVRQVEDARSEFISLTSHQLRVPLTAISGYTDMLLSGMVGPVPERQESFLHTIRRNVDRMSVLIDKLGEMNRIDAGRRKYNLVVFDLTEIIETAILDLEEDLESRRQELVVDVGPSLPSVLADRAAVLTVLKALIDNASRYSADDVIILMRITGSTDAIRIEIADSGVGISVEDQSQMFSLFFRSDDRAIRDHVGWGLALAHAKKVVEALGGTIGFESKFGQGSTFFFTIPTAAARTSPS